MIDYTAIIEDSIAWAQQIMAGYDAQALEDMRNQAAERQAAQRREWRGWNLSANATWRWRHFAVWCARTSWRGCARGG